MHRLSRLTASAALRAAGARRCATAPAISGARELNAGVDFGPSEFSRCYSGTKSGQRNAYGPVRNWELGNGSLGLRFQSTATATDEPVSPVEKFEYQAEVCPSS